MALLILIQAGFREELTVQENFSTAIEKVYPLQPPTSALESRAAQLWHLDDGRETMIHSSSISRVEEDHA